MKSLIIPAIVGTAMTLNVKTEKEHTTVDETCKANSDCPQYKHCTNVLNLHHYCADNSTSDRVNGGKKPNSGGGCMIM